MGKKANDYYQDGLKKNLQGLYAEAAADYTKAIEMDPAFSDAFLKRGVLRYKLLKQYQESEGDFNKAVELAPQNATAYLYRGIVKCHLLKFKEAMPDFDKALDLDPNEERAYFNRGKNKYMLKYDKEEVCADLERAIRLHATAAADLIKLFYGENQKPVREEITRIIAEKIKKD
jgi:tetratricopeptide (TPR) repeat protein